VGVASGAVLLVDDRVGTGWTLTRAALAGRAAGATAVVRVARAVEA
jgi:phosphoribosylpyrophosphate synthetase